MFFKYTLILTPMKLLFIFFVHTGFPFVGWNQLAIMSLHLPDQLLHLGMLCKPASLRKIWQLEGRNVRCKQPLIFKPLVNYDNNSDFSTLGSDLQPQKYIATTAGVLMPASSTGCH